MPSHITLSKSSPCAGDSCLICWDKPSQPHFKHIGESEQKICRSCLSDHIFTNVNNGGNGACPLCRQEFTFHEWVNIHGETKCIEEMELGMRMDRISELKYSPALHRSHQQRADDAGELARLEHYLDHSFWDVFKEFSGEVLPILVSMLMYGYIEQHEKDFKDPKTKMFYPSVALAGIGMVAVIGWQFNRASTTFNELLGRIKNYSQSRESFSAQLKEEGIASSEPGS